MGATIVLDGNLDETFSGRAVVGDLTLQSGYAGQLCDAVQLQVVSDSTNIPEDGSTLLTAMAVNDDETRNSMAAGWSVVYGALSSVDSNGMAYGAPVYQNEPAMAQAVGGGLTGVVSLMVLDTLKDNFGLYATDGIPDAWQVQNFGVNNSDAIASADPDHDGQNNFAEFIVGTSPTAGTDYFGLRSIHNGTGGAMEFVLSPTFTNRTYHIEATTNLANPDWTSLASTAGGTNVTAMAVSDQTNRIMFYRAIIDYVWQ